MRNTLIAIVLLVAVGLFVGWFVIDGEPPFEPHPAQGRLVEANNAFAVDFYKQVAQEYNEGNSFAPRRSFCFSPYSIATLTQAIKVAARGETEQEIAKTLGLSSFSDEDLYGAYGSLEKSLTSDDELELLIANRIWIQKEEESRLLPDFKKRIQEECFFDIEAIDFKDSEASAKRVNAWVSDQTKDLIPEIVGPGDFDELTSLLAINAVYFKGAWTQKFNPESTDPAPFYDSDGKTKLGDVQMMRQHKDYYQIARPDGLVVFRKPYNGKASFVVLLPDPAQDAIEKLEASLSMNKVQEWIEAAYPQELDGIELPKFELENEFPLIPLMQQLGTKKMFDEQEADLSGMIQQNDSEPSLFIDRMYQKVVIKVNEVGTEAAAVTPAWGAKCAKGPLTHFVANRPFLFLVVDDETSSILFMGRYMGPETTKGPQLDNLYKPQDGPLRLPDGEGGGS